MAPMVMTPAGLRPSDKVIKVEPHHVIDGSEGRWRIRDRKTNEIVADHGPQEEGPALQVRAGRKPGPSTPDPGTGWTVYGIWLNATGTPMTTMTASWRVPPNPETVSGQLIYLFNSLENAGVAIAQPVLQWGVSPAGGGNFWAITNWYVTTSATFFSTLTTVSAGDALVGVITGTTSGFDYQSTFTGHPETTLSTTGVSQLLQATITLEAFDITERSKYPATIAPTTFDTIEVITNGSHPNTDWVEVNAITDLGQRVIVTSRSNPGSSIDIYYGNVAPPPVVDVPVPCCSTGPTTTPTTPGSGVGAPPSNVGPVDLPVTPIWIPICAGGGIVPTQADLVDVESWV